MSTQVSPRTTPETQTWVALLRAHASSVRRFNAELVSEHGLTLNDYEVLLHLSHADGKRLRRVDLAGIHAFFRERFSKDEVQALGGLLERLPIDPAEDVECTP